MGQSGGVETDAIVLKNQRDDIAALGEREVNSGVRMHDDVGETLLGGTVEKGLDFRIRLADERLEGRGRP